MLTLREMNTQLGMFPHVQFNLLVYFLAASDTPEFDQLESAGSSWLFCDFPDISRSPNYISMLPDYF